MDVSHRAVTLLGNDYVRYVLALGVLIVIILAVDEHYNVGILLDGAGLTKVGKHGLGRLSAFNCTGEL